MLTMKRTAFKKFTGLSVVLSTAIISSCTNTGYLNDDYTDASFAQSIFAKQPTGSDVINNYRAFNAYKKDFKDSVGIKAFALSDHGQWGYALNQPSIDEAKKVALSHCQETPNYTKQYPCKVINLNGDWIEQPNQARAILATIPKWQPDDNLKADDINVNEYLAPVEFHLSSLRHTDPTSNMPEQRYGLVHDYPSAKQNHKTALAKSIWLYQHYKKDLPEFSQERLKPWKYTAYHYPPAQVLLANLSEHIKQQILANPDNAELLFADYYNINFPERTDKIADLYQWLDTKKPQLTQKYYVVVKQFLKYGEWQDIYYKYLQPEEEYAEFLDNYYGNINKLESSTGKKKAEALRHNEDHFAGEVKRLINLLVEKNRHTEATAIMNKAKEVLPNHKFFTKLDSFSAYGTHY